MVELAGRIIWLPEGEECAQGADGVAPGYYLVLPRPAKAKRRRKRISPSVCLFGPFGDFATARFLDASALSLGLLEQPAEPVRAKAGVRGTSALRPLVVPEAAFQGRNWRQPHCVGWSSLART